MKKLLEFMLKGILGDKDFTVTERLENDFSNLTIKAKPEDLGLIIGKAGITIKAIRNILRVRATLEKKGVSLTIEE